MPLIESQPDAAARLYARSIIDIAMSQGGRAGVEEVLSELQEILNLARTTPKFGEILASQAISAEARGASILRIFKGHVSELTLRFLMILNRKGRIGMLPSMVAAVDAQVQAKFGRVEVDVYTAKPAEPQALASLSQRLQQSLGKEIVLHPHTEPAMIGGVKLRIGDQLVDGSVSNRLRRVREQLETSGVAAMRARMEQILGN